VAVHVGGDAAQHVRGCDGVMMCGGEGGHTHTLVATQAPRWAIHAGGHTDTEACMGSMMHAYPLSVRTSVWRTQGGHTYGWPHRHRRGPHTGGHTDTEACMGSMMHACIH
jgi:hypothetical protein